VDHRRAHAFRTEAEVVAPLVLEPEGRAAAHAEEDVALELERGPLPAGAEHDLAIVRGEPDEHGRDPVTERYARRVNHNGKTNSEDAPARQASHALLAPQPIQLRMTRADPVDPLAERVDAVGREAGPLHGHGEAEALACGAAQRVLRLEHAAMERRFHARVRAHVLGARVCEPEQSGQWPSGPGLGPEREEAGVRRFGFGPGDGPTAGQARLLEASDRRQL